MVLDTSTLKTHKATWYKLWHFLLHTILHFVTANFGPSKCSSSFFIPQRHDNRTSFGYKVKHVNYNANFCGWAFSCKLSFPMIVWAHNTYMYLRSSSLPDTTHLHTNINGHTTSLNLGWHEMARDGTRWHAKTSKDRVVKHSRFSKLTKSAKSEIKLVP